MQLPNTELPPRQQENYLLVLGFDELHHAIEAGIDEDAKSWIDFYDQVIKEMRGHHVPEQPNIN